MFIKILKRLFACIADALPGSARTAWWLIKLTIPVSLAVMLLDYSGWLWIISGHIEPFFRFFGLPGQSAFVLITSIFTNVYSAVAVITTLHIPWREATIIGVMCLISHNFLIETVVMRKTGSNPWRMVVLRIAASVFAGIALNHLLPEAIIEVPANNIMQKPSFVIAITGWAKDMMFLSLKIIILISLLMILQQILYQFGVIRLLTYILRPLMAAMGLHHNTSLSWIVGNTIGLAYGSAIMLDESEKGHMTREQADLLNHHLSISHSQLEDPLLFAAIGLSAGWMIWPRFFIALLVVWMRKGELYLVRKISVRYNNAKKTQSFFKNKLRDQ